MLLRPMRLSDREVAIEAHHELALDDFSFLLDVPNSFDENGDWGEYLSRLERTSQGENVPEGWVPASFLVAEVDGEIVGRVSIRYELNEFLASRGGHIGYGVRPAFRGKGYATQILREALQIVREKGVERALITCDDSNMGSRSVIEKNGGVLENILELEDGELLRRYWIQTEAIA